MQMIEKTGANPFSTRFFPARDGVPLNALLDYILVGPSFRKQANNWRIWNPHFDPKLCASSALQQALITASEHFPITFDLTRAGLDQTDGSVTLFAGESNDFLHIAMDDVALGGGGEDEFNVHISQFASGKPVPLIADFELTEDKIVITYDPAVMSNTTITYTPVENGCW